MASASYLVCVAILLLYMNLQAVECASSLGNETDRVALLAIKDHIRSDPLGALSSWNNTLSFLYVARRNLSFVRRISFQENNFHGEIPKEIGRLSRLQHLNLSVNSFQGPVPITLSNASELESFDVPDNNFVGPVVVNFRDLQNFFKLNLAINQLGTGATDDLSFLSSLSNSSRLEILGLGNDNFGGMLPSSIVNLSSNLISLTMGRNHLTGCISSGIENLVNLNVLGLEGNFLTGTIPFSIGKLSKLQKLSLYGNRLQGEIPSSVGNISLLGVLSLAENGLWGKIPESLVPKEGVFKNANDISVVGNKKLCGGISELQLPNCTLNAFKERRGRGSLLKAIVLTISAILFSVIILSILVFRWKRNSKGKSSFSSSVGNLHRKISYRELHKATDGFSSDSLIGSGSHGMVYKGTFDIDEKIFAVKVLKLENRGASKSFASECQILRNVRHRNLIKVLTVCSSVDFKGNDFHALVFEYIPKGNLDKWLHSKEDGENHLQNLSFMQRLSIAIEVALALEYLHHHCQIPIAHCDLKPGNILLDNDMSAHVGDFGLAKLLCKTANSFSHNHTSSIAIKGSLGYVPPEYGTGGEASTEGGVYSYGIMLLEMFTGKRPTDDMFEGGLSLHVFAKRAMPTQVIEIVDPPLLLEGNADSNNVNGCYDRRDRVHECLVSNVGIGIACSLESPTERMQMVDVVKRLEALRDSLLG
ncbi:hypothetical protein MRB53_000502 [Persea americana]|uniref:Uncharacterized protein n=1 Tax=Persea americana TaxID=3435 RepID=A0ACC2MP94_PERAE|nr:hypothetical protein MRB53_000502 [Persea americana]